MKRPLVLTIAGSDPSGGAGIQSDLRTFERFGCDGVSVITALTAQNSSGVHSISPVEDAFLESQLAELLNDVRPDAIKIGMLASLSQVNIIANSLKKYELPNVVLDPIIKSTSGMTFLDRDGLKAAIESLFGIACIVTPNLPEASILADIDPDLFTWEQTDFNNRYKPAFLIKGGHHNGEPVDTLVYANGEKHVYKGHRIDTIHTHGTGCFLSAAIASSLALGYPLSEAVALSKRAMQHALQHPIVHGKDRGYPSLPAHTPPYRNLSDKIRGIYLVTDSRLRPELSVTQIVEQALIGGAKIIQLREKDKPLQAIIEEAKQIRKLTKQYDALFIVNDSIEIALASDADGVHLGPDDMLPIDARSILGPGRIVGVSVGTMEEAQALAGYADYLAVGAIYGSSTKLDAGDPVGTSRIREISAAFHHHPIVAIGGINRNNIADVARSGAQSAAVISAIITAPDIAQATTELCMHFHPAACENATSMPNKTNITNTKSC